MKPNDCCICRDKSTTCHLDDADRENGILCRGVFCDPCQQRREMIQMKKPQLIDQVMYGQLNGKFVAVERRGKQLTIVEIEKLGEYMLE